MDRNETLADIVAELRQKSYDAIACGMQGYSDRQDDLATRIDAAAKRETVAGNAAAMREALDELIDYLNSLRTPDEIEHYVYSNLFDICDSALAAPPRNCDVGTAEEQAVRFKEFCLPRVGECSENSKCPAKHPCNQIGIRYCQLKWAQLPYEAAQK